MKMKNTLTQYLNFSHITPFKMNKFLFINHIKYNFTTTTMEAKVTPHEEIDKKIKDIDSKEKAPSTHQKKAELEERWKNKLNRFNTLWKVAKEENAKK